MSALDDIAGLIANQIPGIDWAKLQAEGRGGVWNRSYIVDYMVPAYERAAVVRDTLDLDFHFDNEDALKAFKDTASAVASMKSTIMTAVQAGTGILGITAGLRIQIAAYRYIIATAWHAAIFGAALHNDETIQHTGMSDVEIQRHATLVTGMFNALSFLNSIPGALNPLKKANLTQPIPAGAPPPVVIVPTAPTEAPPGQAGLGLAPIAILYIVIGAVVVVAILAWFLISTQDVSEKNALVAKLCDDAQKKGDKALIAQCITTTSNASAGPGTLPIKLLESIMPYLAAGAGIYALIVFAPAIVRSFMAARREAHA